MFTIIAGRERNGIKINEGNTAFCFTFGNTQLFRHAMQSRDMDIYSTRQYIFRCKRPNSLQEQNLVLIPDPTFSLIPLPLPTLILILPMQPVPRGYQHSSVPSTLMMTMALT
jgi:hypothetical protein